MRAASLAVAVLLCVAASAGQYYAPKGRAWNGGAVGRADIRYQVLDDEGRPGEEVLQVEVYDDGSPTEASLAAIESLEKADDAVGAAARAALAAAKAQVMAYNLSAAMDELCLEYTDSDGKAHMVRVQRSGQVGTAAYAMDGVLKVEVPPPDGRTVRKAADGSLSLFGWDYGAKGPLALVNVGGVLSYLPYEPGGQGGAACGCTNAWAGLALWIGDGTKPGETNALEFASESLDRAAASFGYVNAADGASLEIVKDGEGGENAVGIKGFAQGSPCKAALTGMLADAASADATGHLLLARHSSGALHYLPLGSAEFDRAGPTLRFVGTDEANVAVVPGSTVTNEVVFASASDSNVKVTVEETYTKFGRGVRVTFGVYYK